jgi:hypothetical protein
VAEFVLSAPRAVEDELLARPVVDPVRLPARLIGWPPNGEAFLALQDEGDLLGAHGPGF